MSEEDRVDDPPEHGDEFDRVSGSERLHPTPHSDVCERCGANLHVRRGLCRRCRKLLIGEGKALEEQPERFVQQARPAPLHNPPWRRRGA